MSVTNAEDKGGDAVSGTRLCECVDGLKVLWVIATANIHTYTANSWNVALGFLAHGLRGGWLHGTVVERRSLAGEFSLSCARPAADG